MLLIDRVCLNCGKTFRVEPCVVRGGGGLYCGQPCFWEHKRKQNCTEMTCRHCGATFAVKNYSVARGEGVYCSRKCYLADLPPRGKEHAHKHFHKDCGRWYRHWLDDDGVQRLTTNARWEWEMANRPLGPLEHIHHIDGDRTNDSLDNLMIIGPSEHAVLHNRDQSIWALDETGQVLRKCSVCGEFKPRDEYRGTGKQRAWPSYCKPCDYKHHLEWRARRASAVRQQEEYV